MTGTDRTGTSRTNPIAEWTSRWGLRVRNVDVRYGPELESTNTFAKDDFVPPEPPHRFPTGPILYVVGHQTGGRGRGSNHWTDSDGALLATFSFGAHHSVQPILVPLTGLAFYQAAFLTWPDLPWSLKAPNDIYLGAKKVAGILVEAVERGDDRRVMIGIGMNVLSHPISVPTATSLAEHSGTAGEITDEIWFTFLNRLFDGLNSAVSKGQTNELPNDDTEALRDALNLRPGLPEPIIQVGRQGELHTKSGITDWHQL